MIWTPPPLTAREVVSDIRLPDERVAIVGDVHGNFRWLDIIARSVSTLAPGVTTMLQLGDWGMDPDTTDETLDGTGIERIYVTLGNHERWDQITPLLDAHPGCAIRVSDITWLLPRPARLTIAGRSVLSLGGAASVDKKWRREGKDWWPDEEISGEHVSAAIAGGPADLMLTHESPAGTPVRAVREILRTNPMGFPEDARRDSASSRARVAKVWSIVYPKLLIHGHMHTPGGGQTEDGLRVASLGKDWQPGNLGFLDMQSLRIDTPTLVQIREAAGR
ncbi:metallophosphatase family protein [Microbacterium sp. p3-SID338]|uniref:metallophosphoesterase n=1 Tax=Microbacterium sp. p3-SID338 TaxID=2916214 RepID=UPI0021A5B512|nr:metallophosphoesterase [Microbacterium sp. p3-SID338]MCT1394658.1 metallophosphatase family protein [Microbacterium sp. p3-SID338]